MFATGVERPCFCTEKGKFQLIPVPRDQAYQESSCSGVHHGRDAAVAVRMREQTSECLPTGPGLDHVVHSASHHSNFLDVVSHWR